MEPCQLKVIRIIARLNIGGPAIHAVLLEEGLSGREIQSKLITGIVGSSEGDMGYLARAHGVTPQIIPELGREISWRDDFVALWKLWRILATERPHIVHTHTAKAGTLGRIAAVLAGVPVRIHTFHGHVFHGYFNPLKTKMFLLIERGLAILTTKIIAISVAQLEELVVRYRVAPRSKFAVIPLGLDLAPLLAISRDTCLTEAPSDCAEVRIGFISRLVPIKNPDMALRVVGQLLKQNTFSKSIRLIVVGGGELKMELQEQVRQSGLGERVWFGGWKENLAELYAQIDLVILTSRNEGTPVALIEAMAAGLPFVATRVGGVEDLMQEPKEEFRRADGRPLFWLFANGALAESGDEEGFAAALTCLLHDPVRRKRMGQEGRRFVQERFAMERLMDDMQTLYRQCFRIHANAQKL